MQNDLIFIKNSWRNFEEIACIEDFDKNEIKNYQGEEDIRIKNYFKTDLNLGEGIPKSNFLKEIQKSILKIKIKVFYYSRKFIKLLVHKFHFKKEKFQSYMKIYLKFLLFTKDEDFAKKINKNIESLTQKYEKFFVPEEEEEEDEFHFQYNQGIY